MLRGLDGYRYYHKLAQACVLLSTQLYREVIVGIGNELPTNSNMATTPSNKNVFIQAEKRFIGTVAC